MGGFPEIKRNAQFHHSRWIEIQEIEDKHKNISILSGAVAVLMRNVKDQSHPYQNWQPVNQEKILRR